MVKRLNAEGLIATINVLGEDVKDQRGADSTRDSYLTLIESMKHAGVASNV